MSATTRSGAMTPQRLLIWLAFALAAGLLIVVYLSTGMVMLGNAHQTDFYKFYLSAQRFWQDSSFYWPAADRWSPDSICHVANSRHMELIYQPASSLSPSDILTCLPPNLNPPFFSLLMLPLALLDYASAWWLWLLITVLTTLAALHLITRTGLLGESLSAHLLLALGLHLYFPTLANFLLGQVASPLFLLLCAAWLALRRGHDLSAGMLLGLAAGLKTFCGLFLIVLLLTGRWRASAALMATAIATLLLGLLAGAQVYADYFAALQDIAWIANSWNASLSGFWQRIPGSLANPPEPALFRWLTAASSLLVLALLARAARRTRELPTAPAADLLFAVSLPAMLLLSPLGWIYYFQILLISSLVVWHYSRALNGRLSYRLALLLFLSLTLLPRRLLEPYPGHLAGMLWDTQTYSYALLLLFLLCVHLTRRLSLASTSN